MNLFANLTDKEIIESFVTCVKLGLGGNTTKPYQLVQYYGTYQVKETNRHIVARRMKLSLLKLNEMMRDKFGYEDYVAENYPIWPPIADATVPGGWEE